MTKPTVVTTAADLRATLGEVRRAGRSIGLIPTMGALHAGHLSLVQAARRSNDFAVATIFVNPAQFGPHEDYGRYPRTLEADLAALGAVGTDLVFAPSAEDVYGPRHATYVEVGDVAEPLEGRCRPGHFRGVATVVLKLFNMAMPKRAYFGQKDLQQTLVIRRMVADLDLPIEVRVRPTVREPDGLAMSSRNAYLTAADRERARSLYRALTKAAELVAAGERQAETVQAAMQSVLAGATDRIDYAVLADAESLAPIEVIDRPVAALIAAFVGHTRLIDNHILTPPAA
jgi:pantoate--beta-alanine ligase